MRKFIIIILSITTIITIFLLNNPSAKAENAIYVATNGNDQNDGTKSSPFRTLNKAASQATSGTTVYIREGTYQEQLYIKHSGTKSKPIVFTAYNNEDVTLTREDDVNVEGDTALIMIDSKNYITINGLTLENLSTNLADETVMGIFITGSSSHITIENNHVRNIETHAEDGNAHGIAAYGTQKMTDIYIKNNLLEDLKLGASESLVLNGNIEGFYVEDNTIRRSDNIGIDLIGYEGVATEKNADYVREGTVRNNHIYDVSSYGNPAYGEDYSAGGIYVDGGKDISIEKNTIHNADIGIEATSEHAGKYAENINIIDNIVYNNNLTGISIGGYDEDRGGTINSTIARNIMYRNDTKGLGGGQLLLQHDTKNNFIEKNILTAGPSHLFIANYFTTNASNSLRRNVFHKEEGKDGIWVWKDEELTVFSDFVDASNSDIQSSYIDPDYENEDDYNFELKDDSPAKEIIFE
ncbi:DUF1565 domain-containing protein [Oceanobacillus sp. 1P07AA]|uniref:DUF1565 domain-containing protein n=1 Tax=Oceanobacillus sp. 1P07AA TaxID=3132293 RepID=UPI0039A42DDA